MNPPVSNTQDYGIKISKAGYDVNKCPDYDLIFNSAWPSLPIAFEATIDPNNQQSVKHGLGFPPLTFIWLTDKNGICYGRLISSTGVFVDKSIVSVINIGGRLNSFILQVRCFNINLDNPASYNLPTYPANNQPYDNTYGIKVAQSGKDINSNDLNDFILHSRAQSPAILDIATAGSPYTTLSNPEENQITYIIRTPYLSWGIIAGPTGDSYNLYTLNFASLVTPGTNDGFGDLITGFESGTPTLIIMRDPLLYSSTVEVVY